MSVLTYLTRLDSLSFHLLPYFMQEMKALARLSVCPGLSYLPLLVGCNKYQHFVCLLKCQNEKNFMRMQKLSYKRIGHF